MIYRTDLTGSIKAKPQTFNMIYLYFCSTYIFRDELIKFSLHIEI